ncbi:uncharacterized protein LOC111101601 isoform X2 [Crassostrea virginica]
MFVRMFLLFMLVFLTTVERSHAEINGHTVFRHLVKRWNEEIFGCHCSFTIHCTTDSNCHAHGHQFRCVADCCGTKCHAVSESTFLHHGSRVDTHRESIPWEINQ